MCSTGRCGRHPADCRDEECPTHAYPKKVLPKPDILYTYGTLRPNNGGPTALVPGYLYDLGWFPGIELRDASQTNSRVVCEKIEVWDWEPLDRYEGFNPNDPKGSLYIRRRYLDGYIYEYNREVNPIKLINSGDWCDYSRFSHTGRNRSVRRYG